MRKSITNRFPKRRGQSLVEMALFLMIILYIVAAAVDFGIGYFCFVAIRDAAQEGAIYGSIHPADTAQIIQRVQHSSSATPVDLTTTSVSVDTPSGTTAGNPISVTVVYNYPILLPFISIIIGTNPDCGSCIPLHATATGVILVNP